MILSCIDTVLVILSDWRDTGADGTKMSGEFLEIVGVAKEWFEYDMGSQLPSAPPPSHTKTQLETAAASQQRAFLTLIRNGDCSCRLITAQDSVQQWKQWWAVQSKGTTAALCFSNRTLEKVFKSGDDEPPPSISKDQLCNLTWEHTVLWKYGLNANVHNVQNERMQSSVV